MIRFIQFSVASGFLIFSIFATLYEGSNILIDTTEWRYSTPFTQLLYGVVNNPSDISKLDYIVYAAKFYPTFPIIMFLSGFYLLILIGYYTLKQEKKLFAYYLTFIGVGLLLCSYIISDSPTMGGRIMFPLFLMCGLFCIGTTLIINLQIINRTRMKRETINDS